MLIVFSLSWQNTNQLRHGSVSSRPRAAEREFGQVQTRRPGAPAPGASSLNDSTSKTDGWTKGRW